MSAEQLSFWVEKKEIKKTMDNTNTLIMEVSFRELVPSITETGYLTHAIYYYPAKFIPHVVRHCIESFTKEDDWVIDPFAGSGTVGLEAYLCKRNSFLLDLNPLLNHIIPVKIYTDKNSLSASILNNLLKEMKSSNINYYPEWSNLEYWYPPEMLNMLSLYWGWQKKIEPDIYSLIIESSLIKASKHFSYAEHKTPKLFKSKSKKTYIDKLLQNDWELKLEYMIYELSFESLKNINEFIDLTMGHNNKVIYEGGVDSSSFYSDLDIEFDLLISSPPYMQAQEYIRTSKLDLYWLGYSEREIKKLSKLEIPYRKPSRIIQTETLEKVKSQLQRKDLITLLDSYFSHTIDIFENSMSRLRKGSYACIFIGNPKIDGIEVEIWKILKEYFVEKGYDFKDVYEDKIKTRQLFKARNNKNPDGMKSEYLLVLKKMI
jgi:hypothetical protein